MEYHILHIEDSKTDADLIKRIIEKSGLNFSYQLATNEKEVMNAFTLFTPNIVLCDHSLPAFDSKMAYVICKEKNPDLPFILVTGAVSEEFAVEMLQMGVDDYLLKSNLQRLPAAISNVLSKKEAEQKLIASLKEIADYKFALDQSSIVEITDEKGIIKYANDNYLKISKYSREELIGQDMRGINSGYHSKGFMRDLWATIANGKTWKGELKNKAKDGSTYWVDTTIVPFLDNEGKPYQYMAIRTDITERKKLEDLLKKVNELARIGGWEVDLQKNNNYWSDITREIHEVEPDYIPVVQTGIAFYKEGSNRIKIAEYLEQAIHTGKSWDDEFEIVTAKGNERWVRVIGEADFINGQCIRIYGSFQDITDRKKAEEKIKNNEQQLNVIYNTVSDSIFMLSIEDQNRFKFISVNSTFLKTTGLNEEQIIGQYVHNVIPMPSLQMVLEKYNEAITTRSAVSWEEISVYPSGTKTGFVTVSPVIDEKNNCTMLVGSVHDISERKHAEEKITESENRMRLVTSSAEMGIWYWDNKNDVMVWDKKLYQIYDINESQLGSVYEGFLSRLHPEDKDRVNEVMQSAIADKKREYSSEFRIIWDDLSVHYIKGTGITEYDENGNVIKMMGVNWDVTVEKERERHLKLLESVITNTSDSVLITEAEPMNAPGPRILYVNDAFTKMTGYTAEEVIGKSPRILQGPKSDRAELKRLGKAMRKWEPCEITTINYKKNGEEFWINFTLTPIANEKGWFTHWIAIERDVTEIKKYINAIENQNIKLREIAWEQSHIVRAPLSRMMGIVSVLSDFQTDSSEYNEWVKHFSDSASELDKIIRDIVNKAETILLK